MNATSVPIDTAWALGFVLALCRIAAFAVASPIIGRGIGLPGRMAFAVALATAGAHRVTGLTTLYDMASAALVNVGIGLTLGYLTGLFMHLFSSAGGTIDIVSGLAVSTVFDPLQQDQGGVFARMFHLTAVTLFVVAGGLTLIVTGLMGSIRLLPLAASVTANPALGEHIVLLFSRMVRASVELALPVLGVMLLVELSLGIAARFAPQANVFLLGLPAKLLTSITVVGASWVLFPDAIRLTEQAAADAFNVVVRGLGGT